MSQTFNINDINDNDIINIIGLTVNIFFQTTSDNQVEQSITGQIFSVLKAKNLLICNNIKLCIVLRKEDNGNLINAVSINLNSVSEITLSDNQLEVILTIKIV